MRISPPVPLVVPVQKKNQGIYMTCFFVVITVYYKIVVALNI